MVKGRGGVSHHKVRESDKEMENVQAFSAMCHQVTILTADSVSCMCEKKQIMAM